MYEKISKIVFSTMAEFNEAFEKEIPLELAETTPLFGKEGMLDSLGLVSLIVMIEQVIEDELDLTLILADEKAMSQTTSPFLTAGSLIRYIYKLVEEEMQACTNPLH